MLSSDNDMCVLQKKHDGCHKRIDLTHIAPLYVIAVVSNPARFSKRYTLFNEFCERMNHEKNVKLIGIELQQGSRPFQTNSIIKVRTNDELWFKENLINLAVSHLPDDWEYMAWIDTDIEFQNKDWVRETIEQLQTYRIVQLFSHAIDLGAKGETLHVHIGFCYQYVNGEEWKEPKYGGTWHPGYAWAIRRETYDQIGGLIDFPILGSADHHMSLAFIGLGHRYLNNKLNSNYNLTQLKTAYKKLALIYHPDKNNDPKAEEKFTIITKCYLSLLERLNNNTDEKTHYDLKNTFKNNSDNNDNNTKSNIHMNNINNDSQNFNIKNFNTIFNENRLKDDNDEGYNKNVT